RLSTSIRPLRATSVAAGRRPTNDQRLHRSCSTDSRTKPGSSPTRRRNAATGVVRSATTSRQTGTTVCVRASARNSVLVGCSTVSAVDARVDAVGPEAPEEARVLAGVAGAAALLLDDEQQHVTVAVVVGGADVLAVARRVALAPHLLPTARPEHRATLVEGLA